MLEYRSCSFSDYVRFRFMCKDAEHRFREKQTSCPMCLPMFITQPTLDCQITVCGSLLVANRQQHCSNLILSCVKEHYRMCRDHDTHTVLFQSLANCTAKKLQILIITQPALNNTSGPPHHPTQNRNLLSGLIRVQ